MSRLLRSEASTDAPSCGLMKTAWRSADKEVNLQLGLKPTAQRKPTSRIADELAFSRRPLPSARPPHLPSLRLSSFRMLKGQTPYVNSRA